MPKTPLVPSTPSRRRKTEDDPFVESRVSARRPPRNTPTSSRFLSFAHPATPDIENIDIRDDSNGEAGGGGEMGFLVAEHMTTELRRLMALLGEKDVALKEQQEKMRVSAEEEEALKKRLEISGAHQGMCLFTCSVRTLASVSEFSFMATI